MASFPIAGNCLEFLFFNKRQENLTQITAPKKSTIIRDVDVTVVLVPHVGVNCLKIHFKSTIIFVSNNFYLFPLLSDYIDMH